MIEKIVFNRFHVSCLLLKIYPFISLNFQYYFASTVWECYCHCKKIEARRSVQTDNQPGLMLYLGDMGTAVCYYFLLYTL